MAGPSEISLPPPASHRTRRGLMRGRLGYLSLSQSIVTTSEMTSLTTIVTTIVATIMDRVPTQSSTPWAAGANASHPDLNAAFHVWAATVLCPTQADRRSPPGFN